MSTSDPNLSAKPFSINRPTSPLCLSEVFAWIVLVVLLFVGIPLFLRKGLWPDVAFYSVGARAILHGGVLEREESLFFKLPAMQWILAALFRVAGWRMSAVRLVDLAFISGSIWLLVCWLRSMKLSRAALVWTSGTMYAFYLSTTDWCHCQPDMWMFLPAIAALNLRRRQMANLTNPDISTCGLALSAAIEGFLWGLACLFKPIVLVPGTCSLLMSTVLELRSGTNRRFLLDKIALFGGGVLAGGLWMGWLWWGGGWNYFWDDMHIWFWGYLSESPGYLDRTIYLIKQFGYLGLLHLAALPIAVSAICKAITKSTIQKNEGAPIVPSQTALVGSFYIGWLFQANYLQWQFDYHLSPAILLAIAMLAGQRCLVVRAAMIAGRRWIIIRSPIYRASCRSLIVGLVLTGFLGFAIIQHPLFDPRRLVLWGRCWQKGSSPELRDQLSSELTSYPPSQNITNWVELGRVATFLRSQRIADGELTCYGIHTITLHMELDLACSTRFPYISTLPWFYPDSEHQRLLCGVLNASRQLFAISDLSDLSNNLASEETDQPLALPPSFPDDWRDVFPFYEPIIFRAGPYLVHRITSPVAKLRP